MNQIGKALALAVWLAFCAYLVTVAGGAPWLSVAGLAGLILWAAVANG